MNRREIEATFLGRVSYADGLDLQKRRADAVFAGRAREALFLLEHDPVLTLGRNADRTNIVASDEALRKLGITVFEVGRGGDVTYHGHGQLVGYPIVNLSPDRKDIRAYVRTLEEALIRTMDEFGVQAGRIPGLTGVWVGEDKIAAIGVRIARWITTHGFALNITTRLDHFRTIVPCGIQDHGVTSMERLLPAPPPMKRVAERFADHFSTLLDRRLTWTAPGEKATESDSGKKHETHLGTGTG